MNKNIKLILAISLPFLIILFLVGSVLLPKLFFKPNYDFLYTVDPYCLDNDCRYGYYGYKYSNWNPYKVIDGVLTREDVLPTYTQQDMNGIKLTLTIKAVYPKIYRYSVAKDSFNEISLAEAQKIPLIGAGSDPDGTVVINDQRSAGIIGEVLGGNSSHGGMYLKNGSFSKKIIVENGGQNNYYYNSNFRLLGWVKEGVNLNK